MEPVIAARGLRKEYPRGRDVVRAVDGIDLEMTAGTCVALVGPNGAGKTTTLEMILGLTPPTAGALTVLGRTWSASRRALQQRVSAVLQDTRLSDALTVVEQVRLFRSFAGARALTADAALELVRLLDVADVATGALSGGQRQRLALALALAGDPELLVLDEPCTGLDPSSRRDVWSIVEAEKARGKSVILSTHAMDEAAHLADRIVFVDRGKVVADGTAAALTARLPHARVLELVVDPPLPAEAWHPHEARVRGDVVRISTDDLHATTVAVVNAVDRAGSRIRSLAVRERTLDDVFVYLTGNGLEGEAGTTDV